MTATILARFSDGRLLVQESQAAKTHYTSGGLIVRVGGVKTIIGVLSVENDFENKGLYINRKEVLVSNDTLIIPMRRNDPVTNLLTSGEGFSVLSGYGAGANMSGILASANPWMGELISGAISGRVTVVANVLAY